MYFASLALLLVVALVAKDPHQVLLIVCLMGAVGGFLLFNLPSVWRRKATVFLGDAGSTLLGFLFAWLFVSLFQGPERAMPPVTALWLFAIPLMDTVGVMLRRMVFRRYPFDPDRSHLHHLLPDAGFRVSPDAGRHRGSRTSARGERNLILTKHAQYSRKPSTFETLSRCPKSGKDNPKKRRAQE